MRKHIPCGIHFVCTWDPMYDSCQCIEWHLSQIYIGAICWGLNNTARRFVQSHNKNAIDPQILYHSYFLFSFHATKTTITVVVADIDICHTENVFF